LFCDASPDTRNSLLVTTTPAAWFGFRLRAYEAWWDLRAFFPGEYQDLQSGLESVWKRSKFSVFSFQFSGFLLRKWGGVKQRLFGHRWALAYRVGKRGAPEVAKLFSHMKWLIVEDGGGDAAEGGGRRTDC
jgi:hypothetical protein